MFYKLINNIVIVNIFIEITQGQEAIKWNLWLPAKKQQSDYDNTLPEETVKQLILSTYIHLLSC